VSSTFTRTALEQTLQLLGSHRDELADSPALLAKTDGRDVWQTADRLSRLVALLWNDVGDDDAQAARRHLAELGSPRVGQP